FRAKEAGLKDMGAAAKAIGAYQAGGAFVMREWAKANSDALVRYISAYVEGSRWALDPANKAEAIALLTDRLNLARQVAAQTYAVATDPPRQHRQGCEIRHGGLQERAQAARRDRRTMGRQFAAAGEICRSVVLQSGRVGHPLANEIDQYPCGP